GPNYAPAPAPVADDWIEANNPNVLNSQVQAWWNVFNDSTLNSLIDTAYNQNLTLRAAGIRILEARAQRGIAVGNLFPQSQQALGQYSRVGLSPTAANNPSFIGDFLSPQALEKIPGPAQPTNWYSEWAAGFNLSWELDFWGRFRRAIESANANLDVS